MYENVNMKCIVAITYVWLSAVSVEEVYWNSSICGNLLNQYFKMNFQMALQYALYPEHPSPSFKQSVQTLWPLKEVFSFPNCQLLWFLFKLRSMSFNSNRTGRWMIYHNPYYFGDDWSIGNSTFYDYYWQDGSLTIPGIIGAW